MKLSDFSPDEIEVVTPAKQKKAPLRLSDLNPEEIEVVEQTEEPGYFSELGKATYEKVIDPVFTVLDTPASVVRSGVDKYQTTGSPTQGVLESAKFAGNLLLGRKTAKDAPTVSKIYDQSTLKRGLSHPDVADKIGGLLLAGRYDPMDRKTSFFSGQKPEPIVLEPDPGVRQRAGLIGGQVAGEMATSVVTDPLSLPLGWAMSNRKVIADKTQDLISNATQKIKSGYQSKLAQAKGALDDAPPPPPSPPAGAPVKKVEAPVEAQSMPQAPEKTLYPESLDDMRTAVTQAETAGELTELPTKLELEKIEKRLNLKRPVTNAQKRAASSYNARDEYKAFRESGTRDAETVIKYEQLQRNEGNKLLNDAVNNIHPGKTAEANPLKAGQRLVETAFDRYEETKSKLGKWFNRYDKIKIEPTEHVPFLTDHIARVAPEIAPFIEVSDAGAVLRPYSRTMGISKEEYNVLGSVIKELESPNGLTIKDIRNIRGSLLNEFPDAVTRPPIVEKLRRAMLDHIEGLVVSRAPKNIKNVRKTFQEYAQNENNLSNLESILGGRFSKFKNDKKSINSEQALRRIFSSERNITNARAALGEEAFAEAFSNYLASEIASLSKDGFVSSARLHSWLKKNKPLLELTGKVDDLEQIEAVTNFLRIIPDSPTINPSGTAKTASLLGRIQDRAMQSGNPVGVAFSPITGAFDRGKDALRARSARKRFNKLMSPEEEAKKGLIGKAVEGTKGLIDSAVSGAKDAGLVAGQITKDVGRSAKQAAKKVSATAKKDLKNLEKGSDDLIKAIKDKLDDDRGSFSTKELKGLLKPGQENVYDLKKAREVVGEPKGLLPGEGNAPVAKYTKPLTAEESRDLDIWIKSAKAELDSGMNLTNTDKRYLNELRGGADKYRQKVIDQLLEKDASFNANTVTKTADGLDASRAKSVELAKRFTPGMKITDESGAVYEVIDNSNKGGLIMLRTPSGGVTHEYADDLLEFLDKEARKPEGGLVTNLNIEKKRGPRKELPESGELINTVREDTGENFVGGLRVGGISKAKAGPLKGQEFVPTGKTRPGTEASGWNKQYEVKTKDGKSHWFNNSEVYWMQRPDSDSTSVFASPGALAEKEKRLARIREDMKAHKEWSNQQKAADEERIKKGLIGVDFGGRNRRPPKPKIKAPSDAIELASPQKGEVWSGPSGKKYTVLATEKEGGKTYVKVEHVDTSGGRYDGQKITTWEEADDPKIFYGLEKRGESGPPGKKELIDSLMSGEKKVPGIKSVKPKGGKGKKIKIDGETATIQYVDDMGNAKYRFKDGRSGWASKSRVEDLVNQKPKTTKTKKGGKGKPKKKD